jgi:hypothetical protein
MPSAGANLEARFAELDQFVVARMAELKVPVSQWG